MTNLQGSSSWWPPSKKLVVAVALWAAFTVWNGWELKDSADSYYGGTGWIADQGFRGVALNFWGLAAALYFAGNALRAFELTRRRRMTVGCIALSIIIGRLIGSGIINVGPSSRSLLFLIMPFALMVSGAVLFVVTFFALAILFLVVTGIPVLLFLQMQQIDRALRIFRYREDGLTGYLGRGIRWLFNEAEPEQLPDDSKGARFATHREIAAIHAPDAPAAMAFGSLGNPLFLKTEKHILIMASTRSGKGVTLIIPHLLRYRGSAFVLDPKGENAIATGRRRAELNDEVHYLDPFGISGKRQSRFNPLKHFTPENMEAESKALAAAFFIVGERERDHWTAAGQQLLAAIILFVYLSPKVPAHEKDLPQVRKTLLGNLKGALDEMMLMKDADGLLHDLAHSFLETPEKERGSIFSSAQRQTEILDNPFIIASLKATAADPKEAAKQGPEVDFAAWHSGTMTVYLCLSAPKFPTFNRWLRLILTSALDEMTDKLRPPPLPVCFLLDELATLGHLAAVENAVGLSAGYGIQLACVFQDVAQMRDLYKGRWASFIGNAGVRALFSLEDFDTAEYWSKFIGNHQVESRSTQQDIYGFTKGDTVGENMRPLIPADKMMMDFTADKMLVLVQGQHPFLTDRIPYWKDTSLNGLWDDPRDRAARQALPPPPSSSPRPGTRAPIQPQPSGPLPGSPARQAAAAPPGPAPKSHVGFAGTESLEAEMGRLLGNGEDAPNIVEMARRRMREAEAAPAAPRVLHQPTPRRDVPFTLTEDPATGLEYRRYPDGSIEIDVGDSTIKLSKFADLETWSLTEFSNIEDFRAYIASLPKA